MGLRGPANASPRQGQSDGRLTLHWVRTSSYYLSLSPTAYCSARDLAQGHAEEEKREASSDREAVLTGLLSHFSVEGNVCCMVSPFCPVHSSGAFNG